jgi:enhancing lycopene biosynthesis protein 2
MKSKHMPGDLVRVTLEKARGKTYDPPLECLAIIIKARRKQRNKPRGYMLLAPALSATVFGKSVREAHSGRQLHMFNLRENHIEKI